MGTESTQESKRTWGQWFDNMLNGTKEEDPRGLGQIIADAIVGADKFDTSARTVAGVGIVDLAGGAIGVPGLSVTRGAIEVTAGGLGIIGRRVYLSLKARKQLALPPNPTDEQVDKAVANTSDAMADQVALDNEIEKIYREDELGDPASFVQLKGKIKDKQQGGNKAEKRLWKSLAKRAAKNLNFQAV